jgi:hypothetical protein
MKKVNTETMEKQGGSATFLTRVRDNQRRSRARRKEYIQQLERRLRSFESQGVVASQEIQQAGRKVAKENSLLRSLLLLRGVTQDEIQDFLKSHAENTPQVTRGSASASAISRPRTPHIGLPIDLGVTQDETEGFLKSHAEYTPRVMLRSASPHNELPIDLAVSGRPYDGMASSLPRGEDINESRDQSRSIEVHADSNMHGLTTNQPSTRIPSNVPEIAPTLQRFNESHQEQGHFTSCESAARIIASLRGYSDTHELRSELGCGAEANCMVKNLSLFEMLDK